MRPYFLLFLSIFISSGAFLNPYFSISFLESAYFSKNIAYAEKITPNITPNITKHYY